MEADYFVFHRFNILFQIIRSLEDQIKNLEDKLQTTNHKADQSTNQDGIQSAQQKKTITSLTYKLESMVGNSQNCVGVGESLMNGACITHTVLLCAASTHWIQRKFCQ